MVNFLQTLAAACKPSPSGKVSPCEIGYHPTVTNANTALSNLLDLVYVAAGVACVIVIIVAGSMYLTSNANPQKVERAKNAIMGAVAGLVIIMMAFAITAFVIGRF